MTEEQKKSKRTQAQEKMHSYIVSLAYNQDFLDRVAEIRTYFNLPINGYSEDLEDKFAFIEETPMVTDEKGNNLHFFSELSNLAQQFELTDMWTDAVSDYVLYNDFFLKNIPPFVQTIDVQEILENEHQIPDEIKEKFDFPDESIGDTHSRVFQNISSNFPIAIFISPYSSGKDIIDYVKKQYKREIEPLQIKYKDRGVMIGKIRKRNNMKQERDAYIWQNRNIPIRDLVSDVNKKYHVNFDYTYINKIINKKRKQEK